MDVREDHKQKITWEDGRRGWKEWPVFAYRYPACW